MPNLGSQRSTLEAWIKAKYEKKQFMDRGRVSQKEKREEPTSRSATKRTTESSSTAPKERRPAPPSPRAEHRPTGGSLLIDPTPKTPAPVASSGPDLLGGLFGPTPTHPQQQPVHQQQQQQHTQPQGGDLFGMLSGAQPQPQQKTLDKNSILSLYHQPIAPTMPVMHPAQQRAGPNYNVHLVPATYMAPNGMPMVYVFNRHRPSLTLP